MTAQGYSLPVLPMVLPPAIQALMHSPPAGTPEQQVHQAAAAAAAAAAVMSSPYSTYSTMMLPPSIIPMGESILQFISKVLPLEVIPLRPMQPPSTREQQNVRHRGVHAVYERTHSGQNDSAGVCQC